MDNPKIIYSEIKDNEFMKKVKCFSYLDLKRMKNPDKEFCFI